MDLKIPSREQCLSLLAKYNVPKNIVEHSELVARIAVFLGKKLSEKGERTDLRLLEAAALLHDIDKKICLENAEKIHGVEAAKILEKEGLKEIAELVKQHRLGYIIEKPFSCPGAKLVYYADKRVNHTNIVSLDERYDYLVERYGNVSAERREKILFTKPRVLALE